MENKKDVANSTESPDVSEEPDQVGTWGSSRLRERRTLRITELLSRKKNENLKLTPVKQPENDNSISVEKRGRGRPRKRPSDNQDENVVRQLKYSKDNDKDSINENENGESKESEADVSQQDSSVASEWTRRLRKRQKKVNVENVDEDSDTNDDLDPNDDDDTYSEVKDKTYSSVDDKILSSPEISEESNSEDSTDNPKPNAIVKFDHIQKLEDEDKYQCTICNKKFKNESTKTIHEYCKINEKFFTCEYCRQKDLRRSEYEIHLKNHTGKCHFVCHLCGDWFLKAKKWTFHVLLHEGRSHFFCKPCNKRFPYFRRKSHARIHVGEQQFTCHKCKENFVENVNENEIIDKEKQPAAYCASCGEKFKTKFKFYTHLLSESRCSYSCEQCASHFARKKLPFKCRVCKAEFTRRAVMESHRKYSHPSPPKKVVRKRKAPKISDENQDAPAADQEPICENPCSEEPITENNVTVEEETLPVAEEEPIEPLTSVKIKASVDTVFIFESVPKTQEQWQQTNSNNTEFSLDNDFCSQCQDSFKEPLSYFVNTTCGHLLCESCYLKDTDGCLLCIEQTNQFELKNLNDEEKVALDRAIDILTLLAKKRGKKDEPDICSENVEDSDVQYPILLSCTRGSGTSVEKPILEKCLQCP